MSPKYYCVFISLIFIFQMPPIQLFPGAIPWRGIKAENSVIRGSNLKEHKPSFWISGNLSDTFKTQMKQDKLFVWLSLGEKKMG